MEGNVNWIPLGILGLIVVIWATKFLTAIRLKQKLKKAWDGAPFFRKKDTEESLIDSLAYPAKGRTIDSQVDDQTWHDLALDAVFDQLNYTQSSLGAEAHFQPTGQEEPQHGAEHCRKSRQALCRFTPLSSLGLSSYCLSLCHPL